MNWWVSGPLAGGCEKNQRTYPELPNSLTHTKKLPIDSMKIFKKTKNQR